MSPLESRLGSRNLRTPPKNRQSRYIIVVYGPAGCGKTSNAKYITEKFDLKFIEGDEVNDNHPAESPSPRIQNNSF